MRGRYCDRVAAALDFSDIRATVVLLLMAVFGGVIAVAWADRRMGRPDRLRMLDARTQLQVLLDALRARTAILARRDDLDAEARAHVDDVVLTHVLIDSTLARAATAQEVDTLRPQVHKCRVSLETAGATVGLDLPADRPFVGLCSRDPQHGPSVSGGESGVCGDCAAAIGEGDPPPVRLVAHNGRPVPFDQIETVA